MKNYKTSLGYGLVMVMIGLCPLILGVIVTSIFKSPELETVIVPVCYLLGGTLCLLFAGKMLKVDIKSHVRKPETATLVLVIIAAIGWALADVFLVNRESLLASEQDSYSAMDYIGAFIMAFISPTAEELIFRLGALTVMLAGANGSKVKTALSVVFTILPWMLIHFPKTSKRAVDIVLVGIVISLIYIASKNVVYAIAFHMTANCVTALSMFTFRFLLAHNILLYVGIAMFVVAMPVAIVKMCRENSGSFRTMVTAAE